MKTQLLIALVLASSTNIGYSNTSNLLLSTSSEVAAGRNLRNNGTRFCEVSINSGSSQFSMATAVIALPKGARLLDARVKSPERTRSRCSKSQAIGSTNTVQCKLTQMTPNQKITLVARYHQKIQSGNGCSGYIKAGSRR